MNCINAYIVLVSIGLCISAENSDPLTSIQIQEKIKTTTDTLTSIDKLLLDLEARRESLQQMKESFSQERADIYPTSCLSTYNQNRSSLMVQVPGHSAFQVACDTSQLAGLGWLVIQRRKSGKVNFYRDWSEYKTGFGYEEDDYFIGLEKLHWLTAYQPFELYIYLEEF
ncbi:angiopoietin-related protein 7-like [Drosophila rhopaloa]|uniref:Fibrinogen C-terminal domain-containing protein n=1 Tax=Drosophila rhopaloa TaxID=1041015 RepID=A0ABM5J8L5_DRORH|nr:angiopoietin-related protein 7-like [Drosophila rhopaloa]